MNEVAVVERPSSIEVSQNAKGQFSHKVKLYFDEMSVDVLDVVKEVEKVYVDLHKRFK